MLVIALIENHNLDFTVTDLFYTYTMSWHGKTGRRYLTTCLKKEPLIDGLSDTDKWVDFYFEVHGNFEFGDGLRRYSIPKVKDTRGAEPFSISCLFVYFVIDDFVCLLLPSFCRAQSAFKGSKHQLTS